MKNRSSLGVTLTGGLNEEVTPWAGATLLVELYRKAGAEAAVKRTLPHKKSPKGLREEQMVESFVLLSALGGDCLEDMERLRQDKGLEAMLGYPLRIHIHPQVSILGQSKGQINRSYCLV